MSDTEELCQLSQSFKNPTQEQVAVLDELFKNPLCATIFGLRLRHFDSYGYGSPKGEPLRKEKADEVIQALLKAQKQEERIPYFFNIFAGFLSMPDSQRDLVYADIDEEVRIALITRPNASIEDIQYEVAADVVTIDTNACYTNHNDLMDLIKEAYQNHQRPGPRM